MTVRITVNRIVAHLRLPLQRATSPALPVPESAGDHAMMAGRTCMESERDAGMLAGVGLGRAWRLQRGATPCRTATRRRRAWLVADFRGIARLARVRGRGTAKMLVPRRRRQ
jgi:class 3 adenylate cyclase